MMCRLPGYLALALPVVIGLIAVPVQAQDGADIVILGEVHDNPDHHLHQAAMIASLQPTAVVWEMLDPEQVAAMAGIDRTDAAALRTALDWDNSGWPDFAIYHPVLAAGTAPYYGAALPRDVVRRAMTAGAAATFGADAADWGLVAMPPDLNDALATEMQEAHCNALPEEILPGMVEAQRLRDAHFARVVAEAVAETGGPVVVITGNGHARTDRGIPAYLAQGRPDLVVWSLGQIEEGGQIEDQPYDAVRVTPAALRDDPCAGFAG